MKKSELKSKLALYEISNTEIKEAMGVSHAAVSRVLKGKMRSKRIEEYICKKIQMEHDRVFPLAA